MIVTSGHFVNSFLGRRSLALLVVLASMAAVTRSSSAQTSPPVSAVQSELAVRESDLDHPSRAASPSDLLMPQELRFSALLSQPEGIAAVPTGLLPSPIAEEVLPGISAQSNETYPIDLPTALALAGANNLQIRIAAERVNQAAARLAGARALWIPSLAAGPVYNNHSGRIQDTEGNVLEVSRSSLFVGGAAVLGDSPANGGAGGPARMFVDLSVVDAIFEPLAARQLVRASSADRNSTFNDTLLQVAVGYLSLARAQARVAIAEEATRNADELARITRNFADTGQGLQADADRASIEAASRKRDVWQAREDVAVISAELARLLRLDPSVQLQAADENPMPLEFVERSTPVNELIRQATSIRPEVASADAQRDAAAIRRRQEQLRPWLPNLYAGVSGGGFGGSDGSDIANFGGRTDFDVAALWQVENLGFGNSARQREQQSLTRQASLEVQQTRDIVAAEVMQAYQRIQMRGQQIEVTRPPVESAEQAVRLNLEGIRDGELRPIEIQQAIGALALARTQYLNAVTDYNAAQLQMVRAIGQPPNSVSHSAKE